MLNLRTKHKLLYFLKFLTLGELISDNNIGNRLNIQAVYLLSGSYSEKFNFTKVAFLFEEAKEKAVYVL